MRKARVKGRDKNGMRKEMANNGRRYGWKE